LFTPEEVYGEFPKVWNASSERKHTYVCAPCQRERTAAWKRAYPERDRAWRQNNRERVRRIGRKSDAKRAAAGVFAAQGAKRRAWKRDATGPWTDTAAVRAVYRERKRREETTGAPHHVDHILPLSRGGAHCSANLRVTSAPENLSKGAQLPEALPRALLALYCVHPAMLAVPQMDDEARTFVCSQLPN
jgi:hypothetical protein